MSDDDRETRLEIREEGYAADVKRVIAVDVDAGELVVVSEDAYRSRDFSGLQRVPFAEVLWLP